MAYFLRYTENPENDLERQCSYHYDDDGNGYELDGLCAFELKSETLEEAIEEAIEHYYNYVYNFESMGDIACVFEGSFLQLEEEGCLIIAKNYLKINEYELTRTN